MSQYYESGRRTFVADAAYARGIRVKMSGSTANTVTVAVAADKEVGTLTAATTASGTIPGLNADVLLRTAQGSQQFVANAAITVNAIVYTAASGKVGTTASGANAIGIALTAASADGDLIEVLRYAN